MDRVNSLSIEYKNKIIPISIVYKRTRYFKIALTREGFLATVPLSSSVKMIEEWIMKSEKWIIKKLSQVTFGEENFLYEGRKLQIEERTSVERKRITCALTRDSVLTIVRTSGNGTSLKEIYEAWLYNQAKHILPAELDNLSKKYRLNYTGISIRRQVSRWGSCSSKNSISLNYKLLQLRKDIREYVLVHELCHTVQHNHSDKFWKLVEEIIPNHKELRKELKKFSLI